MYTKDIVRDIFNYSLESVLPKNFISRSCNIKDDVLYFENEAYDLSGYKNIYIFGSGKAAYSMAKEMEKILGHKIYKGLVVAPYNNEELQSIKVAIASHPIPTQKSIDSAKALLEMMQECDEDDLYIYLLSGGSSALIEIPIRPITLEELQQTTTLMLSHNLEIHEINAVRKHLSQIKGGLLASSCKARGVVLVISDIIDNELDAIGSAPLYADKSSFSDVKNILDAKDLYRRMPNSVQEVIQKGLKGDINESPFEPLARVTHQIIASNAHAMETARLYAIRLGLSVKVIKEPMEGEVTEMAKKILELIDSCDEQCILLGGECTVALAGDGKGGRNQHLALLMLEKICSKNLDITFLSAATDGIDGNSDAAGAVVNLKSCQKAKELGIDIQKYIKSFDSYNFFKQTNELVMTGPSGTNVIDIAIIIKGT